MARRRLLWLIVCSAASALSWATLTGPWAKRALIDDDQGALRARSLGLNVLGNVWHGMHLLRMCMCLLPCIRGGPRA